MAQALSPSSHRVVAACLLQILAGIAHCSAQQTSSTEQQAGSILQNVTGPVPAAINTIAQGGASSQDVLAVVLLITDPQTNGRDRLHEANSAITLLTHHLGRHTPCHVYVYTHSQHVTRVQHGLGHHRGLGLSHGSVLTVEAVQPSEWSMPDFPGVAPDLWTGIMWGSDYRLMGEWRLAHMPRLMRDKGYRYILQMDDDSFIKQPIAFNIVERMRTGPYLVGARHIIKDVSLVTWGLAELAHAFLALERMDAPQALLDTCNPPSLEGLYTPNTLTDTASIAPVNATQQAALDRMGQPRSGGYPGTILYGNFVVLDLQWWYSGLVQRFLHLARSSGGSVRFRWNEQATMSMAWLLTVPRKQTLLFDFGYTHRTMDGDVTSLVQRLHNGGPF